MMVNKKQIPNIITLLRLVLIPFFIFFAFQEHYFASLRIFVIAALSDTIDGFIARKYNLVSSFGKLFDPLADKILAASALIIISCWGFISWWIVALILARDVIMTFLRHFLTKKQIYLASNFGGKLKTTLQFIAIIFVLFYKTFLPELEIVKFIILIMFVVIAILTWLSAIIYFSQIKRKKYVK